MEDKTINFLVAGVGGQGTLLASDIVAEVGLRIPGMDVKKSEVHGMAQRGGSVVSHVRWGDKVASPLCEKGTVDYFIAQELLEGVRWLPYLRRGGTVILNQQKLPPTVTVFGNMEYPDESGMLKAIRKVAGKTLLVDALNIAEGLGNIRIANTVLLGVLSSELDVPEDIWLQVVLEKVPARLKGVNIQAFQAGREKGEIAVAQNFFAN